MKHTIGLRQSTFNTEQSFDCACKLQEVERNITTQGSDFGFTSLGQNNGWEWFEVDLGPDIPVELVRSYLKAKGCDIQ